ncbi:dnaJ homolog subfamily C member 2-like [Convolutriloba macropyga]|uniref:dnaJ homolog subfamily C member 2-like n=1 Tax=Convolutriloba macropyga TaxID=536237 RepID=UPI003F527D00
MKRKIKTVAVYLPIIGHPDDGITQPDKDFMTRFIELTFGDPIIHEVEEQSEDDKASRDENKENEASENLVLEVDVDYLKHLDPTEWKEHDHYKVLGLQSKRMKATAADIKAAYKQLALKHHPDKRQVPLEDRQSDYFPSIVRSFEILSNPKKRISFDSVDPTFDDAIPSKNKAISPDKFLSTFGPVFERNAQWSVKKPVPLLGDDNTSYDDLMNFYKFWLNFDTWREYSYLDEEEKEKGTDREERRYLDKLNKAERQRRKNAEIARIRQLVDCAMANDPRIKKKRDEETRKKQEERDRKRLAALTKQNEEEAKREEDRKNEESRLKAEQEKAEEEKKAREAAKKELKAQKKSLKDLCKSFDNFCLEDTDIETKTWWLEGIDLLCSNMQVDDLKHLNSNLKSCSNSQKKVKNIVESEIKRQTDIAETKKREELSAQHQKQSKQSSNASVNSGDGNTWSTEEIQCLVKALQLLPPGTDKRWVAISNFINNHVHDGKQVKSAKQVVNKAKNLQNLGNSENVEIKSQIKQKSVETFAVSSSSGNAAEPSHTNVESQSTAIPTERTDDSVLWSPQEQKLLEAALKNYPPDTDKRWEKISEAVPGKSKKDCMKRYKEIVELLKAKKAAQTAKAGASK